MTMKRFWIGVALIGMIAGFAGCGCGDEDDDGGGESDGDVLDDDDSDDDAGDDSANDDADDDAGGDALVFVAVEGDGVLARLDAQSGDLLGITEMAPEDAEGMMYPVHNVQGAPDGSRVFATVVPSHGEHKQRMDMSEQLVEVDAATGEISSRISLGTDRHAAHVVIHGETAYVTAYEADEVLIIDLEVGETTGAFSLPAGAGPHGARLSVGGETLVVAGLDAGDLYTIDTATGEVAEFALPGGAVQTAVTPDGGFAFATIYSTCQLARLDLNSGALSICDLPESCAGPVQIYPTPDGQHVWVADQGMLEGDPIGTSLFRVTTDEACATDLVAQDVGNGPHGVVVSRDGARVFATMLYDGTMTAVDAHTGDVLFTKMVGAEPNGITYVFDGGAMP